MQTVDAAKHAEMVGKSVFPILLVVIYGVYRVVQEGIAPAGWPSGTILVVGGILSAICILAYMRAIESGPGRSWGKAMAGFSGLIPYAYSLYVLGFVGIWTLIQLFSAGFSVMGLLVGIAGLLLGYRILKTFHDITELGNAQLEAEKTGAA
ncbi:hypothetical protein NKH41_09595 [Mesorhizobium sp. M1169]|uniref:hypothetical protein n=1 Tax=Mesorhizobium sp. M1169 TaxID=2957066 RepID=UPI00333B8957